HKDGRTTTSAFADLRRFLFAGQFRLRALPVSGTNGAMAMRKITGDEARLASEAGFTLLELLIVIGIIAVLLGLIFPVLQGVHDRDKKIQARNDLTKIVPAVNAFYTEYGRYPIDSSITTDAAATCGSGGTSSKLLFDELRAKSISLNTRGIVFISPAE